VANNITFLEESFGGLLQGMQLCKDLLDTGAERQRAPDCLSAVAKAVELADFEYLSEEIPNALKECTEGMRRISVIVSAMKDFAHPSGGNMQPVDLPALIESTAEISRNEWKLVADLETQFDPELPNVDGLRDELSQAMLNLIVNAAHAIADKNPGGAERGLIRIVARRNAEWAEVLVADNGCGVPKELQEKIFEPFFTTKEVGRGSGQGLAIVYNVVADKHHGKLTVDSEPGKETVFTIRLPLQAQPLAPNGGL
jgi:signal transduction histidine kinase